MQQAITVGQMAKALGLSRDRFYDLIAAGTFPPPVYRLDNRRPIFPQDLQELCASIRCTGIGFDGGLVTFNRPRAKIRLASLRRLTVKEPKPANTLELLRTKLEYLGVKNLTPDALKAALNACKLNDEKQSDETTVIQTLLRYFARQRRSDSQHQEDDGEKS